VKREAELTCGADNDAGATHGEGKDVWVARGAGGGVGAACDMGADADAGGTCGVVTVSEVPAIEEG
jgi:hypothetical protein